MLITGCQSIFVAGHRGMPDPAIVRRLDELGYRHILVAGRGEADLSGQEQMNAFFSRHDIDQVYLAATKAGAVSALIMQRYGPVRWGLDSRDACFSFVEVKTPCSQSIDNWWRKGTGDNAKTD